MPGAGGEGKRVREFTIDAQDRPHWERILRGIGSTRGAKVLDYVDRTMQMHRGGKISVENKYPLKTRDDLSMAYTPGVARVCQDIHADRAKAFEYTIKKNTVAVVSDGSAVLGPRQHRARGGDAGDGGQGDAVQGVRRSRRLPDLPRHPGRRGDHQGGRTDRAHLRRHQPRGHLRPALLRDRGAAEGVARHPRLPRRPARHRGGHDGRPVQRAEDRRQADRAAAGAGGRARRRGGRGDQDDARLRRHPRRRLRPPGRPLDRARGLRVR